MIRYCGTLSDRSCEIVESLERGRIDSHFQETWCICYRAREIGHCFNDLSWDSPRTTSDIGAISCKRFRAWLQARTFVAAWWRSLSPQTRCYFLSADAPQTSCSEQIKDEFLYPADEKTTKMPPFWTASLFNGIWWFIITIFWYFRQYFILYLINEPFHGTRNFDVTAAWSSAYFSGASSVRRHHRTMSQGVHTIFLPIMDARYATRDRYEYTSKQRRFLRTMLDVETSKLRL